MTAQINLFRHGKFDMSYTDRIGIDEFDILVNLYYELVKADYEKKKSKG